ncbi:MAG: ATP:cob(I)alamin adenosyltransferase, partial [Gammaproteobacteria bacterium]
MGKRLSRIATRTGDDGTTGLGDGSRTGKDSLRIAAIGDVDELNSTVGLLLAEPLPEPVHDDLIRIQHDLFDLGADLATPSDGSDGGFAPSEMVLRIVPAQVVWLE